MGGYRNSNSKGGRIERTFNVPSAGMYRLSMNFHFVDSWDGEGSRIYQR